MTQHQIDREFRHMTATDGALGAMRHDADHIIRTFGGWWDAPLPTPTPDWTTVPPLD